MNGDQYKSFLSEYLQDQKNKLLLLEEYNLPSFNSIRFSAHDISESNFNSWVTQLASFGINNRCSVLYYFKIIGSYDRNEICSIIKRMKTSPGRSERALPKVNEIDDNTSNDILYVGKTNLNFINRFKQHLGLGAYSTFALHLLYWAKDMNLELEMHFAECIIEKKQIHMLEHIESVLHYSFKPILGRQGR